MAKNVLIIATRYDAGSARTFQWAEDLHGQLLRYADNCLLADVTGLCRAGSSLHDLIEIATHVVFYGHGERDRWLALPGTSTASTLVDGNTVSLLNQRTVYAGCCLSLSGLGQVFQSTCTGDYIGYNAQFGFDDDNEVEFRRIVNQSVINLVAGIPPSQVVSDLKQEWASLSQSFTLGHLRKRPNAVQAGHLADLNSQRIGKTP